MKLNNYLFSNLYSFVGYFDILLFLYMFIISELYIHNSKLLNNSIFLSIYDLCNIYTILQVLAVLFLIGFLIEFIMYKFNIKIVTINFDNIFYKIIFYFGFIVTSFGIFALIAFYTLMIYSK